MTTSFTQGTKPHALTAASALTGGATVGTTLMGTVPAGKCWYVFGISINLTVNNSGANMTSTIKLNDVDVLTCQAPDTGAGQYGANNAGLTTTSEEAFTLTAGQTVKLVALGGRSSANVWYNEVPE